MDIKNIQVYNERMRAAIQDKLFFMDHIQTDYYVDIGCADAYLGVEIKRRNNNAKYFGFDYNDEMLELAKKNLPDATFSNDIDYIFSLIPDGANAVVIFSSVLHEIFSVNNLQEFRKFCLRLKTHRKKISYISVRDMYDGTSDYDDEHVEDVSSMIVKYSDTEQFNSFSKAYGRMDSKAKMSTLYHFLLKYRYVENWDRELLENYFALSISHFLHCIEIPGLPYPFSKNQFIDSNPNVTKEDLMKYESAGKYDIEKMLYFEQFTPQFIKDCVKRDFNVDMKYPTHLKMIVRYS